MIVGGGVTGLTAAYTLDKEGDCEVTLLEAAPHLGGKVGTAQIPWHDSTLVVEQGADSLFTRKPWAIDLAEELGLGDQLVEPQAKEFSMLIGGKLHRVPGGLVTLTYSEPDAVNEADFLTDAAKKAVTDEPTVPAGNGSDESIASFFRRRFGEEFSRVVAEPLLAGTHGGSPETLSMKALYPAYFDLEREFGSLAGGMVARKRQRTEDPVEPRGKRRNTFLSFKNGMGTLVETLVGRLGKTRVELDTFVESIDPVEGGLKVTAADGRKWIADDVILATPAYHAARIVQSAAPEASERLHAIKHVSGAIVTLAYPANAVPGGLSGTGFLVPYHEKFPVTGGTWSSNKWPGRAPSDTILVRLFLGRFGSVDVDTASEESMIEIGKRAFEQLFVPKESPIFETTHRWRRALPQYEVGHLERLDGIVAALTPLRGLHLAGTSYRGVGIPDCVRQGRDVAQSVLRKSSINHE